MRRSRQASVTEVLIAASVCTALMFMSLSFVRGCGSTTNPVSMVYYWLFPEQRPARCKSSLKNLGESMRIYLSRYPPAPDSVLAPDFAVPDAGPVPTTAPKKAVDAGPANNAEK